MPEARKCSVCGADLPAGFSGAQCAQCAPAPAGDDAPVNPGQTIRIAPAKLAAQFEERIGETIGRYKLLEKIGEGGFGAVYVAEQKEPVRRRVALKVIKLGMDTEQVVARFEAERQALAMMDHPNIAKVLDAGATDSGRPYFVMELVRGIKFTDYCDQSNLSTRERLELFAQVCRAIQHAHQKGIIHRDIKPSNILVTLHDGAPVPKVIDFGLAKATQGNLTDKTIYTEFRQFMGTPAYMSPEQADLSGLDVDTRSDIYSLGVLLYELLTGKTPFGHEELYQAGLDELRKIIREKEPAKPSTRISTLTAEEQTAIGKHHRCDAPKLISLVKGDLDWIVMKCLEKDRTRRYETANGLALDLQRYLSNEPVLARPPSSVYQLQKLIRRNKLVFAAASAIAATLVIGLALSGWALVKEQQARQRAVAAENAQSKLRQQAEADEQKAKTEAAKSRQVAQFLKEMLNSVGPSAALGRDTTMLREILDKTAESVGKNLNEQPDVLADMQTTLGEVYFALAEFPKAEAMEHDAVKIRRQLPGSDGLLLAQSLDDLGVTLEAESKAGEAINAHNEALAIRRKLLGNENPDVAKTLSHLGQALNTDGKHADAETAVREAVAMQRKLFGNDDLDLAQSLNILGNVLRWNANWSEAESACREALAIRRKRLGNEHPAVAESLQTLANLLRAENKLSEAEDLYRETLELRKKLLSNDHPLVMQSLGNLGSILKKEGKQTEAVAEFRKWADQGHAAAQVYLARFYADGLGVAKDPAEAARLYRKAADQGDGDAQTSLAGMYQYGTGVPQDFAEAVKWFRKAADSGNHAAECSLGSLYIDGQGVPKDEAEGVKWFRKAAEQGYGMGQNNLGWAYHDGIGVPKDLEQSLKWYTASAKQGNVWGEYHLAGLYDFGQGVAKNPTEAARWYTKAADQGNSDAAIRLVRIYDQETGMHTNSAEAAKWYVRAGQIYENGTGVRTNEVEGLRFYRKSAELGDGMAQNILAWRYSEGRGVAKDMEQSVKWFKASANQGYDWGQERLGELFESGLQGVPKDLIEAERWYRKAADQGNAPAEMHLGQMYESGQGVTKDLAEATQWYHKAAEKQNPEAMDRLAGLVIQLSANGDGKSGAEAEAVKWYTASAIKGNVDGQLHLARLYESGQGVTKDTAQAVNWYRQAARAGNASALISLVNIYEHDPGAQTNLARVAAWYYGLGGVYEFGRDARTNLVEAARCYRKAAELGNANSQIRLAQMYASGQGVTKDLDETIKWYRRAAEQGTDRENMLAQYALAEMYERGDGVPKDIAESEKWYQVICKRAKPADLNDFAWSLATSTAPEKRSGANAVRFAEKAVAATNRKDPTFLDTLAGAYAEAQQFDKAVAAQQEAIDLSQTEQEIKDCTTRLKLYQSKTPYREP